MSCDISQGRGISCKEGAAGLLSLYFLNEGFAVGYDETDTEQIDNIYLKDVSVGAKVTVYEWKLDHTGANFQENVNSSRDNGTYSHEQVITAVLQGLTSEDTVQVKQLLRGKPACIVHYRNGDARLVGLTRGIDTQGNNQSGGALSDFKGYNLTLTANEQDAAPFLKGATITDAFAGLDHPPTVIGAS